MSNSATPATQWELVSMSWYFPVGKNCPHWPDVVLCDFWPLPSNRIKHKESDVTPLKPPICHHNPLEGYLKKGMSASGRGQMCVWEGAL